MRRTTVTRSPRPKPLGFPPDLFFPLLDMDNSNWTMLDLRYSRLMAQGHSVALHFFSEGQNSQEKENWQGSEVFWGNFCKRLPSHTGQEQACSRITWLVGCLWPCQKWLNTQKLAVDSAQYSPLHRSTVYYSPPQPNSASWSPVQSSTAQ